MDIWSMTRAALEEWFRGCGENPAKAAILYEYIYQRGLRSFAELPFAQRVISALEQEFTLELPETEAVSGSEDTAKILLRLADGEFVESVLMRQEYGGSVAFPPRWAAPWGADSAQSGRLKKRRSLSARGNGGAGHETPPGVFRGDPQRHGHGDRRAVR